MVGAPGGPLAGIAPTGRQLVVKSGDIEAVVTEVGAGLRALSFDGVPVVWGYEESSMASGGRGQLLAPWPNRLEDGRYEFETTAAVAPLDEPGRHNAIHGLVRWLLWDVEEHTEDRATLSCELAPQPGYPWRLRLEAEYSVGPGGLVVVLRAHNRSESRAPFGIGAHPYLAAGPSGLDACTIRLGAGRRLVLDSRGLPRRWKAAGTLGRDLAGGRSLSGLYLDDCFGDLGATADGEMPTGAAWQAVLTRDDGLVVGLWADSSWPYVMCYTGDTLGASERRRAVAIEPMTCPPNALRTGESIIVLEPGVIWSGRFGIWSSSGP